MNDFIPISVYVFPQRRGSKSAKMDEQKYRCHRWSKVYENSTQLFKINGPANNFNIDRYPYTSMEEVNFEGLYDIEVRIVR